MVSTYMLYKMLSLYIGTLHIVHCVNKFICVFFLYIETILSGVAVGDEDLKKRICN